MAKGLRPVIIGNGTAAVAAAEAICRQAPGTSPILISEEDLPPYSPTALIGLAAGRISEEDLFFRPREFYARQNIEAWLGEKAAAIEARERFVILEDGEKIAFSSLLLASGARPFRPDLPGLLEARPLTLRTLADARRLRRELPEVKSACILGGGLIGLEIAQLLLARGIPTRLLEVRPQILPSAFDCAAAGIIQRAFEERGGRFFLNAAGLAFESRQGSPLKRVALDGARPFEADLLVCAAGVAPRTELAAGILEIGAGVLVRESMETSVPGVYAAGDLAQAAHFFTGEKVLNPILPAAAEQGRVAGINMAGGEAAYAGNLKMNILNFFGRMAFAVGETEAEGRDEVILCRSREEAYGKIILKQGELRGGLFVHMDLDPGILQAMVASREDFSGARDRLAGDLRTFSRLWMMKRRLNGLPLHRRFSPSGPRMPENIPE